MTYAMLRLATLEDRITPTGAVTPAVVQETGLVRLIDPATQATLLEVRPFEDFAGPLEVALGDVNDDSYEDVITAATAGGGPRIQVRSGKDGNVLQDFLAYESSFRGGLYVASADVNGDGRADIVTGTGPTGGARVRAFSGGSGQVLRDFLAFDGAFRGGVTVTATDCDLDGFAEIITGAGPGGTPHVRVFGGDSANETQSFFAFEPTFTGGVFVACADINHDGHPDILTTPGNGGGPIANRYDGQTFTLLNSQMIGDPTQREGTRLPSDPEPAPNAVQLWNRVTLQAIRDTALPPPRASRLLAMVHIAQYNAVQMGGNDVALATTAERILSDQVPTYRKRFESILANGFVDHQADANFASQQTIGQTAATQMLQSRASDGSATIVAYTPGTDAGDWQPTPPANAAALLPGWGRVTPFTLTSGDQFRPIDPPAITSPEYAVAFEEVQKLGAKASPTRTADQTQIAKFWADGSGTVTPPGHWNVIAQRLATRANENLQDTAKLFAVLNAALADAAIASWDVKYATNFWRPVTAIRQAASDGNSDTSADTTWEPLLTTPPFPSYTSGHSTFSGAAAAVLTEFFGTSSFHTSSDALPDVTRSFTSFVSAAAEAGKSRIYGGIHFQFDNQKGLESGQNIGNWAVARFESSAE